MAFSMPVATSHPSPKLKFSAFSILHNFSKRYSQSFAGAPLYFPTPTECLRISPGKTPCSKSSPSSVILLYFFISSTLSSEAPVSICFAAILLKASKALSTSFPRYFLDLGKVRVLSISFKTSSSDSVLPSMAVVARAPLAI